MIISYWISDTQDVVAVKDRLLLFSDQLVLISDETFVKVISTVLSKKCLP